MSKICVTEITRLTTNTKSNQIVRSLPPLATKIPEYKTFIVVRKTSKNMKITNPSKSERLHVKREREQLQSQPDSEETRQF